MSMTSNPQAAPVQREAYSLKDKVVLLTGASQGLGQALADALEAEGAKLMLASRSMSNAQSSPTRHSAQLDVADAGAVRRVVDATYAAYGRIDVLINNAAICGPFQLFQEHSPEEISAHIDINLKGPMLMMQAVLPGMIAQGAGDIVNINSIAGKQIYAYCSVYGATKFGLDAVAKTISEEQRANGIRVLNVYPGRIDTPIWNGIEPNTPQKPNEMLSVLEVTSAVLFGLKQPRDVEIRELLMAPRYGD